MSPTVLPQVDYTRLPVGPCVVSGDLFEVGIGPVIVSRKLEDGRLATGFFLVDTYCMGVKDAFFKIFRRTEFKLDFLPRLPGSQRHVDAAYAVALIEQSVEYAASLGLAPHSDYRAVREVLAGIDTSSITERFTFGDDGKPYFVPGPNMRAGEVKSVLDSLNRHVGKEGYVYLMAHYQFPR